MEREISGLVTHMRTCIKLCLKSTLRLLCELWDSIIFSLSWFQFFVFVFVHILKSPHKTAELREYFPSGDLFLLFWTEGISVGFYVIEEDSESFPSVTCSASAPLSPHVPAVWLCKPPKQALHSPTAWGCKVSFGPWKKRDVLLSKRQGGRVRSQRSGDQQNLNWNPVWLGWAGWQSMFEP